MKQRIALFLLLLITLPPAIYGQQKVLVINEIMAINDSSIKDEDGDYSDWIELYNGSSDDISLAGWSLTDDPEKPGKWYFPVITLKKGEYLIVFASSKNRRQPAYELHTNFKLSGEGEYLALLDPSGSVRSGFVPEYPKQRPGASYGFLSGSEAFFISPSPGKPNLYKWDASPPVPVFSIPHGYFINGFNLILSSPDPAYDIYFTRDGSFPDLMKGEKYSAPLSIDSTTIVRACCIRPGGYAPGMCITATYLFPGHIINQPALPQGYPSKWGPFTALTGLAPADYEMDPEIIVSSGKAEEVKDAFRSLPTVSLVTDKNFLFSDSNDPETGGIYIYTGPPLTNTSNGTGFGWERPVSFEYFAYNDSVTLQVNCGVELHGGHSRRPEKSPKHSFRLVFRRSYGLSKLIYPFFGPDKRRSFDALVLRAGFNNTWVHHANSERTGAQYIQDAWAKDVYRQMGHPASEGFFVHLFINGLYWGVYNLCEKPDKDFAAEYLGGNPDDYDVMKDYTEVADGNALAWTKLMAMVNYGVSTGPAYQRLLGNDPDGKPSPDYEALVDPVSLADYMILNFYAGNTDWDHHNWVAIRNRNNPGTGFTFHVWDSEKILENVSLNILSENNNNCPSRVYQQLIKNPAFKRLFADRVQKFLFCDGALTPANSAEAWIKRSNELKPALIAEAARWGDYRRDVHPYQTAGPFFLYDMENFWLPYNNDLLAQFFPVRTDIFLNQLRAAGLFPLIDAPQLKINGTDPGSGLIKSGDVMSLVSTAGDIFYTTDGSDPVIWNTIPSLSPSAKRYTVSAVISNSTHIRARAVSSGTWSAMTDIYLLIRTELNDIKITEIHYQPLPEAQHSCDELEFVELKNTGTSALNLKGLKILGAVRYLFINDHHFGPGEFFVIASDRMAFFNRYGFMPDGEFDGDLSDEGEILTLTGSRVDTLISVLYREDSGWPRTADGYGNSLVPADLNPKGNQENPDDWRASYYIGGSPGKDDLFISGAPELATVSEILTLYQPWPNPFSSYTNITYSISSDASIDVSIFDLSGKQVTCLEKIQKPAGEYVLTWKGISENGQAVDDGVYLCRVTIRVNGIISSTVKKIVLKRD